MFSLLKRELKDYFVNISLFCFVIFKKYSDLSKIILAKFLEPINSLAAYIWTVSDFGESVFGLK